MEREKRTPKTPGFYLPQLDGLRFVAFLLVFIHNAPYVGSSQILEALHEYGWIGVDLFFCLSTFLLTRLLVIEFEQYGKINIKDFYLRRILKIWPLYFFYLLVASLFIFQSQGWSFNIAKHLSGLITFTYDFVYPMLTRKIYYVFVHLWTISYEVQFYALIPWTIHKLVNKKNTAASFLFALFLIGNVLRAALIFTQAKHPVIYMLPFTHFEAALCGVAMGAGFFDNLIEKISSWVLFALGVALNSIVFFLPNTYEIGWSLMLTYPLAGIGMSLIVYSLTHQPNFLITKVLTFKPLLYLGRISFGLYIYQILSVSIIDQILRHNQIDSIPQYSLILFISNFFLILFLSILSYEFLEKYFYK